MNPSPFFHTALSWLLAVACLLPAGTRAQTPVPGGTLIVAQDGPVTATLLGSDVPTTHTYSLNVWWATGPGPGDIQNGGSFASQFNGQSSPAGSSFVSPPLRAGTPIVIGATILSGSVAEGNFRAELIHTGMAQPMMIVQPDTVPTFPLAGVSYLSGNRAEVGFPLSSGGGSFVLRVGVSNACSPG